MFTWLKVNYVNFGPQFVCATRADCALAMVIFCLCPKYLLYSSNWSQGKTGLIIILFDYYIFIVWPGYLHTFEGEYRKDNLWRYSVQIMLVLFQAKKDIKSD